MPVPAHLVLADDHPLFRSGLRALLEQGGQLSVVAEASSTSDALAVVDGLAFDLAIIDVVLPEIGGAELARHLRSLRPLCKILALSLLDDPLRVADMIRAGASGYALKSQPAEQILEAVHSVLGDIRYLAPGISGVDVDALLSDARFPLETLTDRERAVFDLLVVGNSNEEVAQVLEIARSTVETHRMHIMKKLAASSIVDLVHLALRHGVMGPT